MSRNTKILLLFTILLASSVAAALLATFALEQQTQHSVFPFRPQQASVNPADFELYYVVKTVLSIFNIALLMVLVITYASIYLKTRSEFTIGLVIFAVVFLFKDIASSPFTPRAFGFALFGLGPFAFIPDLLELAALAVLLYLSVKY